MKGDDDHDVIYSRKEVVTETLDVVRIAVGYGVNCSDGCDGVVFLVAMDAMESSSSIECSNGCDVVFFLDRV